MKRQLSLVELATYGYASTRVKEGSWLEKTFGTINKEVEENEFVGRFDKDEDQRRKR